MTYRVYHRPGWTCDCGCPNGAWRTTCFRCDEPKPEPKVERTPVCGRTVVRAGWGRAHCFQPQGHKGDCK